MERQGAQIPETLGELTFVDLADTDAFCSPPLPDGWGVSRVPFSRHAARMSAELAANVYGLEIKPWREAGWTDCTFVIEDKVVMLDRDDDSRMAAMESEWKRRRARSLIHGVSPFADISRAIRQLLITDLGKSIVMTRPARDGKIIIAISFIGTTQKYFDWFSNFKFQQHTGMHFGFLELAKRFDAQAPRIVLPKLAGLLGEESFTLADVLLEAQKPESRFVLWISGHSQGGAIVQTYTHLLMSRGVPCEAIRAYSFAAPTVAAGDGSIDPKQYPVYNIINSDDVVPRVGAQVRLGVDYVYRPNDAFRKRHYRVEDELEAAYTRVRYLSSQVQTTGEAICWFVAFMRLVREIETDGELEAMFADLFPHAPMLRRMNLSVGEVAEFLESRMVTQHADISGTPLDEVLCRHYQDAMHTMLGEFDAKTVSKALMKGLGAPHRMRPDKHDEDYVPPYLAIVRRYLGECVQAVWMPDRPARAIDLAGTVMMPRQVYMPVLERPDTAALPAGSDPPQADIPDSTDE